MAINDAIPQRVVNVALRCNLTAYVLQACIARNDSTEETLITMIEELSAALRRLTDTVKMLERNALPLHLQTPRNDNDDD